MTRHVWLRQTSSLLPVAIAFSSSPRRQLRSLSRRRRTRTGSIQATDFDRNRIGWHAAGALLAIVRGEGVIFARGFGSAEIEKAMPVTPDMTFLIGSTMDAFTAKPTGCACPIVT